MNFTHISSNGSRVSVLKYGDQLYVSGPGRRDEVLSKGTFDQLLKIGYYKPLDASTAHEDRDTFNKPLDEGSFFAGGKL